MCIVYIWIKCESIALLKAGCINKYRVWIKQTQCTDSKPSQWHTKSLQTSTNLLKIPQIHKNLHKETWNYHCSSFSSYRWWTVERTNHWDEQDESNNRDEPPQEPEGKVWVSFIWTVRGGSNMADRSAECWWSLLVSPGREQPGAESVAEEQAAEDELDDPNTSIYRASVTVDSVPDCQHGWLCRRCVFSIKPFKNASLLLLVLGGHVGPGLPLGPGRNRSIKWVQVILQAWCCQMFSIRSGGNVVLLKQTHTLGCTDFRHESVTDHQKIPVQFQT